MAKRQHRRAISVRPETYLRVERLAQHLDLNVTAAIESVLADACERAGVAEVDREYAVREMSERRARAREDQIPRHHEIISQHFTF